MAEIRLKPKPKAKPKPQKMNARYHKSIDETQMLIDYFDAQRKKQTKEQKRAIKDADEAISKSRRK